MPDERMPWEAEPLTEEQRKLQRIWIEKLLYGEPYSEEAKKDFKELKEKYFPNG